MKSITVCVIVCAIALNFSLNCANPQEPKKINIHQFIEDELKKEEEQTFNPATWKDDLNKEFKELANRINATWLKCNEVFSLPEYQVDMFSNAVHGTNTQKCLADCTLRLMGVVQNDDKDPTRYIAVINDLRLKYTEFDITDEECFSLDVDHSWTLDKVYPDMCHILYSNEANECIDLQDPFGDSCQSSWMVLGCMATRHRAMPMFRKSPFYPMLDDIRRLNERAQS